MTDLLSDADRDACAGEAMALIEAVLDRMPLEARSAFWAAIDRLYRSEARIAGRPPRLNPDAPPP